MAPANEVDDEAPGTTIVDESDDAETETPKRTVRKALDESDDDDEAAVKVLAQKAVDKAVDDDSDEEPAAKTAPRKTIIERDGSEVRVPGGRRIVRPKISTTRRVTRGPVVVNSTTVARKRGRPVKRA
jgi:hypothetical protein